MMQSTMAVAASLLLLLFFAAKVRVESFTPPACLSLPATNGYCGAIRLCPNRNPNRPSRVSVSIGSSDGWTHPLSAHPLSAHPLSAGGRSRHHTLTLNHRATSFRLHESPPSKQIEYHPRMGELTPPEATVYQLLHELHDAGFAFRVVVVGRGSIAEFTVPCLGPKLTISQSPSSGANLLTLASTDASWEYHVQLSDVFKVALVEKQTPAKTLRIVRLMNATGDTISSLILVPDHPENSRKEDEAIQWFHGLVETYGSEIQL
jgi:hypothetical protein